MLKCPSLSFLLWLIDIEASYEYYLIVTSNLILIKEGLFIVSLKLDLNVQKKLRSTYRCNENEIQIDVAIERRCQDKSS